MLVNIENNVLEIFNKVFSEKYNSIAIRRDQVPAWDSVRHVELILELQAKFNIKFKVYQIIEVKNLSEISEQVKILLSK